MARSAASRGRWVCPTAPVLAPRTGSAPRTARSALVPATSSGPMLWGSMQSDGSHTSPVVHNKSCGPLTTFPPTVSGDLAVDAEGPTHIDRHLRCCLGEWLGPDLIFFKFKLEIFRVWDLKNFKFKISSLKISSLTWNFLPEYFEFKIPSLKISSLTWKFSPGNFGILET